MSNVFAMPDTFRSNRPLLLALEVIGWLHMAGKAKVDFLQVDGGQKNNYSYKEWYKYENSCFPWNDLLQWVKNKYPISDQAWPPDLTDFISKHANKDKGLLGLLQAAHGITSGVEKNISKATSEYLKQKDTHLWSSSVFGEPTRNLLKDLPEILSEAGWRGLVEQIQILLKNLEALGNPASPHVIDDIEEWWEWRESVIGKEGWLRKAFSETLAETRLPNNDVSLFDQSYVTAALFKSAAAGAILESKSFPWDRNDLKQTTRWRLLTVGMSADYYEGRSVQIGDWIGARSAIDEFFIKARKLIEVELAIGSLLYIDDEVSVFSFPGEQTGTTGSSLQIDDWRGRLTAKLDDLACEANFETPPYCAISNNSSRSLVGMTREIQKAKETLAIPLHRNWSISGPGTGKGHVCPVCLLRRNDDERDKQKTCKPCTDRRHHRRNQWLAGGDNSDSIWISEVADGNDRLALLTMSLDIESWLDGSRLDSLRSQAIGEWRKSNPELTEFWQRDTSKQKKERNPVDPDQPYTSLKKEISTRLKLNIETCDKNDLLLANLQEGYRHEKSWESFYEKIVEDRSDAPTWADLTVDKRAEWLTHQLFRKLASPGRIYRFQRQSTLFFEKLLSRFRELSLLCDNRWRTCRMLLKPAQKDPRWRDGEPYNGHLGGAPIDLLWKKDLGGFITIANLERLSEQEEDIATLHGNAIELRDDNNQDSGTLTIEAVMELSGLSKHLGVYYPIIPLNLSPRCFRVLVPLEVASPCIDEAFNAWETDYARVWDRLPLRIGVVAFPRKTPFQVVIEATRNMEDDLNRTADSAAHRRVVDSTIHNDESVSLSLSSSDSEVGSETEPEQWAIPIALPDGRPDAFYPYMEMDTTKVFSPSDFREPKHGHVYRHAKDLKQRDAILVYPSRIATLFLDDTGRRFEPSECRSLKQWARMRELWELLNRAVPSQTALRGAWSDVLEKRELWKGPDGSWLLGGQEAWLDFVVSIFKVRLKLNESDSERVVCAAKDGILEWCLEWNLHVCKKRVGGGE
jgi:CRISPR-associated Csx11 family protein